MSSELFTDFNEHAAAASFVSYLYPTLFFCKFGEPCTHIRTCLQLLPDIMPSLRAVEGPKGDVWVMMKDRVLFYISPDGTMHVPGDVVAHAVIPEPPP